MMRATSFISILVVILVTTTLLRPSSGAGPAPSTPHDVAITLAGVRSPPEPRLTSLEHSNFTSDAVAANSGRFSGPDERETAPDEAALRHKVQRVLDHYYRRQIEAHRHSPWAVMHWAVGYGVDAQLRVSGRADRPVSALGWLCWNGACAGDRLLYVGSDDLHVRTGPGVQGHEGQFLAVLAQSRVPSVYPMRVGGREFTVNELIRHEQSTCQSGTELTFKLIGLAHYLPSDATWRSQDGKSWTISRLIQEELAQPVIGAACGGTHRMMGVAYAVRTRQHRNEPFTGQWARADKFLRDYHAYNFTLQNNDGSFSSEYFAGRGDRGGPEVRLETTGHVLEWFVYSLPREQLVDPRVVKAVGYLTSLLDENRHRNWEIGPLGHSLHALVLYEERAFGAKPGQRPERHNVAP